MSPKVTKPKQKSQVKPTKKKVSAALPPTSSSGTDTSQSPILFYGHTSGPYDFLSQHYSCAFTAPIAPFIPSTGSSPDNGEPLTFLSTEQYMMYHKALLFSDTTIATQILATPKPSVQKALGRKVSGFDDSVWKANRERIVEEGNWWKFVNGKGTGLAMKDTEVQEWPVTQKSLKERLLETDQRELVEASPRDRIWGIGFGKNNAEMNRERWGLNLLGKALMRVRNKLREVEMNESGRVVRE